MKLIVFIILTLFLVGCQKKVITSDVAGYENVKKQPAEKAAEKAMVLDMGGNAAPVEQKPEKPDSPPIYFDFDKSNLSEEAQLILVKIAKYMVDAPESVHITGHCDERGSDKYNDALGQRRAEAAKDRLIANGVPLERIKSQSFGKRSPIVRACADEPCHAKNRRDEFEIK
jgi:peptidoglycan-associated lipoprotein